MSDTETPLQRNLRALLVATDRSAREVSLKITDGRNDSLIKAILADRSKTGGSKNPRQDTLEKLADYFRCSINDLVEDDLSTEELGRIKGRASKPSQNGNAEEGATLSPQERELLDVFRVAEVWQRPFLLDAVKARLSDLQRMERPVGPLPAAVKS